MEIIKIIVRLSYALALAATYFLTATSINASGICMQSNAAINEIGCGDFDHSGVGDCTSYSAKGEGADCPKAQANCLTHLSGEVERGLEYSSNCRTCEGPGGNFPCAKTFGMDGACAVTYDKCTGGDMDPTLVECHGTGTVKYHMSCADC